MDTDENAHEIIRTVMDLTSRIGISVIAEGVERRSQVDQLLDLGCDLAQGFYFARPMDPEFATKLTDGASLLPVPLEERREEDTA
jgi:EAL domain-containing protein (putative c-di-GMP-specific phosphodiesterase class I)